MPGPSINQDISAWAALRNSSRYGDAMDFSQVQVSGAASAALPMNRLCRRDVSSLRDK